MLLKQEPQGTGMLLFSHLKLILTPRILGGVFAALMPEEYFSHALYTIDIGQNDLTQGSFANKPADDFVPGIIRQLTTAIKGIYAKGGRYFWIHYTGPLGCLSYTLTRTKPIPAEFDSVGYPVLYIELARQFNSLLIETMVRLRKDLPRATFTYVDVYSVKYLLISHSEEYAFEYKFTACCGYGGGEYNYDDDKRCGYTTMINGTKVLLAKACKNPSKRITWDGVHYTEAANRWIFNQISTGKFSDPRNSPNSTCRGN